MTSFYYYDQNPSGFCFREQIRSFVIFAGITEFEYERKNGKDSGHSKMTPLCKCKRCFRSIGWALSCKTVRMYAQAVKQKVWSEAEKWERDYGRVRLVASRVWDS